MALTIPKITGQLLMLAALAALAVLLHVILGSSDSQHPWSLRYDISDVFSSLASGPNDSDGSINFVVWQLRLPRAIACLAVGMVLGIVGSAFQALFRNPLAEPYVVGAASGAAVGGAAAASLGFASALAGTGMMVSAASAGLLSLLLVMAIARTRGIIDPNRLLISGVVISSMLSALLACIVLASGDNSNRVLAWLLGSITQMSWFQLPWLIAALVIGGFSLFAQTKNLNAFAVGEDTASRLGVNTKRLKPVILVSGTIMTAVVVGLVGIIGFLGMVSPHISRRIVGVDWRASLPASAFVGASLLTWSDVLAQWAIPGAELPVGIITALLGAPALLFLLRKEAQ